MHSGLEIAIVAWLSGTCFYPAMAPNTYDTESATGARVEGVTIEKIQVLWAAKPLPCWMGVSILVTWFYDMWSWIRASHCSDELAKALEYTDALPLHDVIPTKDGKLKWGIPPYFRSFLVGLHSAYLTLVHATRLLPNVSRGQTHDTKSWLDGSSLLIRFA